MTKEEQAVIDAALEWDAEGSAYDLTRAVENLRNAKLTAGEIAEYKERLRAYMVARESLKRPPHMSDKLAQELWLDVEYSVKGPG